MRLSGTACSLPEVFEGKFQVLWFKCQWSESRLCFQDHISVDRMSRCGAVQAMFLPCTAVFPPDLLFQQWIKRSRTEPPLLAAKAPVVYVPLFKKRL